MIINDIQCAIDDTWVNASNGDFGKNLLSDKATKIFGIDFQSQHHKQLIFSKGKLKNIIIHDSCDDGTDGYYTVNANKVQTYSRTFSIEYTVSSISEKAMDFICQLRELLNDGITDNVDYSTAYSRFNEDYCKVWLDHTHYDTLFDPMTGLPFDIIIKENEMTLSANYIFHTFNVNYKTKQHLNEN